AVLRGHTVSLYAEICMEHNSKSVPRQVRKSTWRFLRRQGRFLSGAFQGHALRQNDDRHGKAANTLKSHGTPWSRRPRADQPVVMGQLTTTSDLLVIRILNLQGVHRIRTTTRRDDRVE